MDGGRFASAGLAELLKNALQPLLYPLILGQDGEMIRAYAAAALMTERLGQHPCKGLQYAVTLGKAVPCVEELHPVEVDIQQDRHTALLPDALLFDLCLLKEVCHVR